MIDATTTLLCILLTASSTDGVRLDPVRVDPPAATGAMAPNLAAGRHGVLLTWLEPDDRSEDDFRLQLASFRDGVWSTASTITRGRDFFANWADLPSVVQAADGALVAHWLWKSGPGTYAYDVKLARSRDAGRTWHDLGTAHHDGTETEHGFVSMVPEGDGVRIFWLDGGEESEDDTHDHAGGSMTLRTALLGETMTGEEQLDVRVCECCDTSAAVTDRGPVVVYRDRSATEVRDISVVRGTDRGWTTPRPIHDDGWRIAGCPVNGPAMDARGAAAAVAWFTAAGEASRVLLAFSRDGAASFGAPIVVDESRPAGRVDVALLDTGEALISWLDADDQDGGAIKLARLTPDGRRGDAVVVSRTSLARVSGFPKIARAGSSALVVWSHFADDTTRIRAAVVPLTDVPSADGP